MLGLFLTGIKLSSQFNIKNNTNNQDKHDLVYFSRFPSTIFTDSYIGETAQRLSKRVVDHADRNRKLHIVRHCFNSNHETVNIEYFKILNVRYNNNTYRGRLFEALFLKQYRPSFNVQDNSVPLELFNCK